MKYVRHEEKGFFLFPDLIWHMHMGMFLGRKGLISAGFVRFKGGLPECYGRSESLGLGGKDDDTKILRNQMGVNAQ